MKVEREQSIHILNSSHPLWSVGFRPFFILAFFSGAIMPLLWGLVFSGAAPWTSPFANSLQWHGHEMLYGFGWAILGGFLLTATKNWVKIRGYHGLILMFLVVAWLLERVFFFLPAQTPKYVFWIGENVFLSSIVLLVLFTLLKYRKEDQFPDNWYFTFALPFFIVAKNLLLKPEYFHFGWMMSLGLFRMAFVVMLERTVPQFMKNSQQTVIKKRPLWDHSIKTLTFFLIFSSFFPTVISATLYVVTSFLFVLRFFLWHPLIGFKKFEIGIMYLGYLAIGVHFLTEAFRLLGKFPVIGDVSTHIFTFLAMGVVIAGMLTRISMGHTGRQLVFQKSDKFAIWFMIAASFVRLLLPQFAPSLYSVWISASALGWTICFATLAVRLVPFLLSARVDGRVH